MAASVEGTQVLADLLRDIGVAFLNAARRVEGEGDEGEQPADPLDLPGLGKRQRQVLEQPELKVSAGVTTVELAKRLGIDQPNAWNCADSLRRRGVVEEVPGSTPQAWRLAPKFRN